MSQTRTEPLPPVDLGLAAVVLALIALSFFVVPILALAVGWAALATAALGFLHALAGRKSSLRMSTAGGLLACIALAISGAISLAPDGLFAPRTTQPELVRTLGPAFVAPPAPPRTAPTTSLNDNS
jgi:hypothetical protein